MSTNHDLKANCLRLDCPCHQGGECEALKNAAKALRVEDNCTGLHCKCMDKGCPNHHYADCLKGERRRIIEMIRQKERERVEKLMMEKIIYIGSHLPQIEDGVDKFVLLGTPDKFLSELKELYDEGH